MKISVLVAAFAAPLLVGLPVQVQAQPVSEARGHFETTPGPRGTTRWVTTPTTPRKKAATIKPIYRLVQLAGPRGGTRLVKTRPADPTVRHASTADCDCSMMNDATAKEQCKMSMPEPPPKAG